MGENGYNLEAEPGVTRWPRQDFEILVGRQAEIRAALGVAGEPTEVRLGFAALRVHSRLLGRELWIAAVDQAAEDLRADGCELPVLTLAEITTLIDMGSDERRRAFESLVRE